jgi:hypothetical protein
MGPVLDHSEKQICDITIGLFSNPSWTLNSIESPKVSLFIQTYDSIDRGFPVKEIGVTFVMMDEFVHSMSRVPGATTNCITQFTFEMNMFPLEWPIMNHVEEKIGQGFKRLTNHKAVADEDLRDA